MDDAPLFVEITDTVGDLQDHMSSEVFAEICELDDLVKEFATLHHCDRLSGGQWSCSK
jgi:hypothetical protein